MAGAVYIICDEKLKGYASSLVPGAPVMSLRAGEDIKTLQTVECICRWLLSENADRDALLLAVGGGVITDITGFAASVYKRGIRYANYPTTLLAMVDAATGGKTAVNLDGRKNMIGSFQAPEYVSFDVDVLETLPRRELLSGLAEMLKTFIIADGKSYHKAVELFRSGSPLAEKEVLASLIRRAAAIKMRIVRKDPFDRGVRRSLNLGHTVAHALEWKFPGRYLHGEAVSIGIVAAAETSSRLGLCSREFPSSLKEDFLSVGLPVELPCPAGDLLPAVMNDKKSGEGMIVEPLPQRIGKVKLKELGAGEII